MIRWFMPALSPVLQSQNGSRSSKGRAKAAKVTASLVKKTKAWALQEADFQEGLVGQCS